MQGSKLKLKTADLIVIPDYDFSKIYKCHKKKYE